MCVCMHVCDIETSRDKERLSEYVTLNDVLLKVFGEEERVTSKQSRNVYADLSEQFLLPYASLSFCRCPRRPVWTSRSFSAGGELKVKQRKRRE